MTVVDVMAGMSMEDIRKYESEMHSETNKIVGATTELPAAETAAVATASARPDDDEDPSTPSNTPTEKSAPFQFPVVENSGM